jgi:deoxyribose-phosphate aldolase
LIAREELARMIDHTRLQPNATSDEIKRLCGEAVQHRFAAVVVNPAHLKLAASEVRGSPVKVCSVISFPFGLSTTSTKVHEAKNALAGGAQEIDMVMNFSALRSGCPDLTLSDIKAVVECVRNFSQDIVVKIIVENCYLTDDEKRHACGLAIEGGADFVKTSTGFGTGGATVEDVRLMRSTVGPKFGVKAAGGVRTLEQALKMIEAGANRIGTSSGVSIVQALRS